MIVKEVVKQHDENVNKLKFYTIHAVIIQRHVMVNNFSQTMRIYLVFEITSILYFVEVATSMICVDKAVTSIRHIHVGGY